jgi:hypothetical protein
MSVSRKLILPRKRRQAAFIRELLAKNRETSHGTPRVIVSLSTLPDRISNLVPTLESMLNQTRVPDEIVLAIPEFSLRQKTRYVIPKYLDSYSKVRVLQCARDWGPATKFIPVIQEELAANRGDTLIMVVDDDRIYPPDALEIYLHYHRELPDGSLCFRGMRMPSDLKWIRAQTFFADKIREPKEVAVITGCGSYFIQPRFFDERLWDYSGAPQSAFYMDDIWISGWLDRRKIAKYVVPASAMMRTARAQRGTMTLHQVPDGRRKSNNETIAYFADTWRHFSPRLLERLSLKGKTGANHAGGSQ